MKKAKIYKPSKTAMQSGLKKYDKWIIEFITKKPGINPLMGWESSSDTYSELNLEFKTKELAIEYAKKNKIENELLNEKIDIAVHALKDMPSNETEGLLTNCFLERNDPREVLISNSNNFVKDLRPNSIIGTSSFRREFQLKNIRNVSRN